jgi:hypothetical protein
MSRNGGQTAFFCHDIGNSCNPDLALTMFVLRIVADVAALTKNQRVVPARKCAAGIAAAGVPGVAVRDYASRYFDCRAGRRIGRPVARGWQQKRQLLPAAFGRNSEPDSARELLSPVQATSGVYCILREGPCLHFN